MKKNNVNTINNNANTNNTITTTNNTTMSTKKEEKIMKNTTNTNTTTATNNANTLTLAGVQINLTAEQAAAIAAMLLGGTAPTAPKKARSKKAVSEAVTADIVKAEDVKAAETPSTDQYERLADQYTDFKVEQDGNKLSFKTANGGFLYKKTPRYALNNRIKAICADKGLSVEYSNDCWAWVVINPRTGKAPGKSVMTGIVNALSRPIEEHELQAVRDDWAAKKAAKAAKAAK